MNILESFGYNKLDELSVNEETKKCSTCNKVLSLNLFEKRNDSLDGFRGQCKNCINARKNDLIEKKRTSPKKKISQNTHLLQSFDGLIQEAGDLIKTNKYYLGSLCARKHGWNETGYSLRYKGNSRCIICEKETRSVSCENKRYKNWLKNPRISPSVVDLVEKSAAWARVYRKELFMSPSEREEFNRKECERYKNRYQKNPEKEKLRIKKWKHANPQRRDRQNETRVSLVRSKSDRSVTKENVEKILSERSSCPYCSCEITPETATIDHIEPLSKGGLHSAFNLVSCCRSCNCKKHDKLFASWITELLPENQELCRKLYYQRYGSFPEQMLLPLTFS